MKIVGRISEYAGVISLFLAILLVDNESLVPSVLLLVLAALCGVIAWAAYTAYDAQEALEGSRQRNAELRERNFRLINELKEISNEKGSGNSNSDSGSLVYHIDSQGRINAVYRRGEGRGSYRVL